MKQSYLPKATEGEYCEGLKLCSVRNRGGVIKVGVKTLVGELTEEDLSKIINSEEYNGKKIVRIYSSGHVFLSENKKQVFLVTTEKNGKIQHQFTGGSPLEEENIDVIINKDGKYSFNIEKVRKNAEIRTKNRTGVKVLEDFNDKPIVDWALMENEDENGEVYYKLVCLMHFIVKKYEGVLGFTGNENVTDGKWYNIDDLPNIKNVAPNAYIVSKKSVELIEKLN